VLHETTVTVHQIHIADTYIAETGVIVKRVIDTTESSQPIAIGRESSALLAKS
jgi:hypothetical protein